MRGQAKLSNNVWGFKSKRVESVKRVAEGSLSRDSWFRRVVARKVHHVTWRKTGSREWGATWRWGRRVGPKTWGYTNWSIPGVQIVDMVPHVVLHVIMSVKQLTTRALHRFR